MFICAISFIIKLIHTEASYLLFKIKLKKKNCSHLSTDDDDRMTLKRFEFF